MITIEEVKEHCRSMCSLTDDQLKNLINFINSFEGMTLEEVNRMYDFLNNRKSILIRSSICKVTFSEMPSIFST